MLILLYFTDYKGAVLASGLFAGVAGLATAVSLLLPQQFYGFGFLLGAAVFFIVALLRLDTYTANLPYRILSQQPLWRPTKRVALHSWAACSTVPSSAMRNAVSRASRMARLSARWFACTKSIGEVLMTDRMMSRRRLFEAAAGVLLLSGCSVQEDSSTKKVKEQDEIKKAEARTGLSTCAIRTSCTRSTTTRVL